MPDAFQPLYTALLGDLGLSPAQVHYVEAVFRPLLTSLLMVVVGAMPTSPAATCVQWLLEYLRVPNSLSSPVLCYLKVNRSAAKELAETSAAECRAAEESPRPATADDLRAKLSGGRPNTKPSLLPCLSVVRAGGGSAATTDAAAVEVGSSAASSSRAPRRSCLRHRTAPPLVESDVTAVVANIAVGANVAADSSLVGSAPSSREGSRQRTPAADSVGLANRGGDAYVDAAGAKDAASGMGASAVVPSVQVLLSQATSTVADSAQAPPRARRSCLRHRTAPAKPQCDNDGVTEWGSQAAQEAILNAASILNDTAGSSRTGASGAAAGTTSVDEERLAKGTPPGTSVPTPPTQVMPTRLSLDPIEQSPIAPVEAISSGSIDDCARKNTVRHGSICPVGDGSAAERRKSRRISICERTERGSRHSVQDGSSALPSLPEGPRTPLPNFHHRNSVTRLSSNISICEPIPTVSKEERAEMIRKLALFRQLSDEEIQELAERSEIKSFDPEQAIIQCGEANPELHIVVSGEGRVMQPVQMATVKAGDAFGEHCLVKRHTVSPTSVLAQSGRRLVTLAIVHEVFDDLRLSHKVRRRGQTEMDSAKAIPRTDTCCQPKRRNSDAELDVVSKEKTHEDRSFIRTAIMDNTHMRDWLQLSEKQMERMLDLMVHLTIEAGQEVIKIGERGDTYYIVQEGVLEVLVPIGQEKMKTVKCLTAGDSFGELALLYNTPRKATVRALRDCNLWQINRVQFGTVMKVKCQDDNSNVERYQDFVSSMPIFAQRLSKEERMSLVDTLEEVSFNKGEDVVRQGDDCDTFFIILEGLCELHGFHGESKGTITNGSYIGERALLNGEPWAHTVTVVSEKAVLLTLDSMSFHTLLGVALEDHKHKYSQLPGDLNNMKMSAARNSKELIEQMIKKKQQHVQEVSCDVPLERLARIGLLGSGTYGNVSLRIDSQTGKMYALKAMSKQHIRQQKLKSMVRNEKKSMQSMESPFVVQLYCTYTDSAYYYLLLEPVLGGELFTTYNANSSFFGSKEHAVFYSACCAWGLKHIHSHRIVYRDLKMENVLLHTTGYATLTDMGCAKVVVGKTYTVCGTTDYFAPETLKRVGHNFAVDWWALGVLLFTMMSGRPPFDADDVMEIYKKIIKGFKTETFPQSFSSDLVAVIKALCHMKPPLRLGMGKDIAMDFNGQPFFQEIPLEKVKTREFAPPFKPRGLDVEELTRKNADRTGDGRMTEIWCAFGSESSSDSDF